MPERHAKLLEIGVGQLRQDIGVDFIRAKERLVLSEAQTSEPTPDIHVCAPRAANGSSFGRSALSRAGLVPILKSVSGIRGRLRDRSTQ